MLASATEFLALRRNEPGYEHEWRINITGESVRALTGDQSQGADISGAGVANPAGIELPSDDSQSLDAAICRPSMRRGDKSLIRDSLTTPP